MKRAPLTSLDGVGDEQLLTPADVAAIASLDVSTATKLLRHAVIPGAVRFTKRGGLRITAGALREFMRAETLPKNRPIFDLRARLRRSS